MIWSSFIIATAYAATISKPRAEFSASAILFWNDIFPNSSNGQPRCVDYVDRIADQGGSRVMFVPTFYWHDRNPNATWATQSHIDSVCYFPGDQRCKAATASEVQDFESQMTKCFKRAVDRGLDIALTPHLDSLTGLWRNGLVFSPVEMNNGFTYEQTILLPLANALKATINAKTKVWFGMMGEMSACVFAYPQEWQEQAERIRQFFKNGNVKVGISTNFNKLCHCLHVDTVEVGNYLEQFKRDFYLVKDKFNMQKIKELYENVDFFAISSYPSLTPDFQTKDLNAAAVQFDQEVALFGVDIKDLIRRGKEFWFAEYGLGGGSTQEGKVPAPTAAIAARYPFFTIFGELTPQNNPWSIKEVNEYRTYFIKKSLEYLTQTDDYNVSGLFNWNLGTYDFQDIYSPNPLVRSQELIDLVKAHNLAVRGQ